MTNPESQSGEELLIPRSDWTEVVSAVICTSCCKAKNTGAGLLPAVDRYESPRIREVLRRSQDAEQPLLIFSGKFGLLDSDTLIPNYDQRLLIEGMPGLLKLVVSQLQERSICALDYAHYDAAGRPDLLAYELVIAEACRRLGIEYSRITILGSEPLPGR